jgi:hypothetical protein
MNDRSIREGHRASVFQITGSVTEGDALEFPRVPALPDLLLIV